MIACVSRLDQCGGPGCLALGELACELLAWTQMLAVKIEASG